MDFKFPDVGEGITEGQIVKWKVKVGDKVKADQPIADVETDKAVVEIPCPVAGKIKKITHKEGDVIKVGEVLAVIDEGLKPPKPKEHYTGSVIGFLEEAKEEKEKKVQIHKDAKKRVKATFKIRQLAKKVHVDLTQLIGSGPDGRITELDVKKATQPRKSEDHAGSVEKILLKGVRKTTSEHTKKAHLETVHITNFHDADVTKLWEIRKKEKVKAEKKGIKLTFLPYVIQAVVKALKDHPSINSSLEKDHIILKKYYNIGVAVDTDDGLVVPVVKDADKKDLYEIAKEIGELAEKARQRKLTLKDMREGSFTITNLGSVGVKYFTPIINYPEAAILGTGRIEDQARVIDGKIVVRKIFPLSLTYDHRIIDGGDASRFMVDVINQLENF